MAPELCRLAARFVAVAALAATVALACDQYGQPMATESPVLVASLSGLSAGRLRVAFSEPVRFNGSTISLSQPCSATWTLSASVEGCVRTVVGEVEWASLFAPGGGGPRCGVVQSTRETLIEFSMTVTVQSRDPLQPPLPPRQLTNTLELVLQFPTTVSVGASDVSVSAPSVADMRADLSDPAAVPSAGSVQGVVALSTRVAWPYQLANPTWSEAPAALSADVLGLGLDCAASSACTQHWELRVSPQPGVDVCSLGGSYRLRWDVACRQGAAPCTPPRDPALAHFFLGSSSLCPQVADSAFAPVQLALRRGAASRQGDPTVRGLHVGDVAHVSIASPPAGVVNLRAAVDEVVVEDEMPARRSVLLSGGLVTRAGREVELAIDAESTATGGFSFGLARSLLGANVEAGVERWARVTVQLRMTYSSLDQRVREKLRLAATTMSESEVAEYRHSLLASQERSQTIRRSMRLLVLPSQSAPAADSSQRRTAIIFLVTVSATILIVTLVAVHRYRRGGLDGTSAPQRSSSSAELGTMGGRSVAQQQQQAQAREAQLSGPSLED